MLLLAVSLKIAHNGLALGAVADFTDKLQSKHITRHFGIAVCHELANLLCKYS